MATSVCVASSATAMSLASPTPPPPFLPAQWAELNRQALVFKYLLAGVPVPPYLVAPASPDGSAAYYAFFGKKVDTEPWRCRRTDGKKWRCSKEANLPESKYCERHMHRNRSRKPVESKSPSLVRPPSAAEGMASNAGEASVSWSSVKSKEALSPSSMAAESKDHGLFLRGGGSSHQHSDYGYYDKSVHGYKGDGCELSFVTNAWQQQQQHRSPARYCTSGDTSQRRPSLLPYAYPVSPNSRETSSECELGRVQPGLWGGWALMKVEEQPLRPFLEEWPRRAAPAEELEEDREEASGLTLF